MHLNRMIAKITARPTITRQTGRAIFKLTFWWVVPAKAELGCEADGAGNPVDRMSGGVDVGMAVLVMVEVTEDTWLPQLPGRPE